MGISPTDRATWTTRERHLSALFDGAEDPTTKPRDEIQRSWQRCARFGVSITDQDLPYDPDFDDRSRLRRAADPVIDRYADQLAHTPATILLADRSARIVARRVGQARLRSILDNAQVAPGFFFTEEHIGTNGLGTALEERRLLEVRGGEHYRESLHNLACVATPIIHPIGNTVEGILDITCDLAEASGLMVALVTAAVREIEARLAEEASGRERALLQGFLQLNRRANVAIVTMSHAMLMANPAAAQLLDPSDHAVLWDWATRHLERCDEHTGELRLAGEVAVQAHARRVTADHDPLGVTLELRPTNRPQRRRQRPRPATMARVATGDITGRSLATGRVRSQLDDLANAAGPVLIAGEHGVGKTYAAAYLSRQRDPDATTLTVTASSEAAQRPEWVGELHQHLQAGGHVIVRDIDELAPSAAMRLQTLVDDCASDGHTLIATANDAGPSSLTAHFAHRVDITALRHRTEDIPDLAGAFLQRHSPPGSAPRLQPAALQCLTAHEWPANVRELEATLAAALVQARHRDIAVEHLPESVRSHVPANHLTTLERLEREALIRELHATGGNKAVTAARLGIARSTLYRKMRAFGLEADRFPDRADT
ncbi:MAG: helix-turn-helix domain-containing protein [Ilumatobacteraceae bacterium]